MTSEWMKVMLEEIARKQADAEQMRLELERRRQESDTASAAAPPPGAPPQGAPPPPEEP